MKAGQASRTAELVCMGRAVAHGVSSGVRFEDPTALALLSADARARVERLRAGAPPRSLGERLTRTYLTRQAGVMVARTVAIDDAIREADAPQLVVLGAGLDGRAWRMPELADVVVFEVDHPDTQREKRERIAGLTRRAHDVRFVGVDFTRDSLDDALAEAGHDANRPTTWIWEGVVMYLTREAVDATLAVIARRSAPQSRLVVIYHSPAALLWIMGPILRRIGEPLRSKYTPDAMRALLARHALRVTRDDDVATVGASLSAQLGRDLRHITHLRIAVADR